MQANHGGNGGGGGAFAKIVVLIQKEAGQSKTPAGQRRLSQQSKPALCAVGESFTSDGRLWRTLALTIESFDVFLVATESSACRLTFCTFRCAFDVFLMTTAVLDVV